MTITPISTYTVGAGTQFIFAAAGDQLIVLPGVTLGSTGAAVITSAFDDVHVTVLGNLFSRSGISVGFASSFEVAANATFVSFISFATSSALALQSLGSNHATIDGLMSCAESIAIVTGGNNNVVTVSGTVSGSSGVYLNLANGTGDSLVNSGSISANSFDDAAQDNTLNNAVFSDGLSTKIANLASGVITAISSEGAGIRFGDGGGGTVKNAGQIISTGWFGVDFSLVAATSNAILYNSGVINGEEGSFNGGVGGDTVINRGTMIGDVQLGDGGDSFDGRFGRVDGKVDGGLGVDTLDFRNGFATGGVDGGGGKDYLYGGALDDTMQGGTENDMLRGLGGDDVLGGQEGDDAVYGGTGDDSLYGDDGNDGLIGGTGDDALFAEAGNDVLFGGRGEDSLYGGTGTDSMDGGADNDTYLVDDAGDVIVEGAGGGTADWVAASASFTLAEDDDIERLTTVSEIATTAINLTGNGLSQEITGNAGINSLNGGGGNDTITGLAGADTLSGGTGIDSMIGGTGDDWYFVDTASDIIVEVSGGGTADRILATASFTLAADDDIELLTTTLQAGVTAINLTGNAVVQQIIGNAGNNILNGGGGSDSLIGLGGADQFVFTTTLGAGNVDKITDFSVVSDTIQIDNAVFAGLVAGVLGGGAFAASLTGDATTIAHRILYETDTGALFFDADGTGATAKVQFATVTIGTALTSLDFLVI